MFLSILLINQRLHKGDSSVIMKYVNNKIFRLHIRTQIRRDSTSIAPLITGTLLVGTVSMYMLSKYFSTNSFHNDTTVITPERGVKGVGRG